jgi:hypothetical protein
MLKPSDLQVTTREEKGFIEVEAKLIVTGYTKIERGMYRDLKEKTIEQIKQSVRDQCWHHIYGDLDLKLRELHYVNTTREGFNSMFRPSDQITGLIGELQQILDATKKLTGEKQPANKLNPL